jgi:hypothetical protein
MALHVGLPTSGTTFLTRSLADNTESLGDRGVLYPRTRDDLMFRAALDVRGNHKTWGRRRREVEGAWDALCARARRHTGTTVVSQELLAAASQRQVDAAMSMLKGVDVHVVVTARDPARQLASAWQEGIEHGRQLTFVDFEAAVRRGDTDTAHRFHAAQDLPAVLERWGRRLPADHLHVVVEGPPGTAPRLLWNHFAKAVGFDPSGFPPASGGHSDVTLGGEGIDLLRRVNAALDGRLPQPAYGRLVRNRVARELLSVRGAPGPQVPLDMYDALVPVGERWAKELDKGGYVVHGHLHDLVPAPPAEPAPHPDTARTAVQVESACSLLAELLLDLAATQDEVVEKDAKRRSWKRQAKKLRGRLPAGV